MSRQRCAIDESTPEGAYRAELAMTGDEDKASMLRAMRMIDSYFASQKHGR